jgi:hypothetical protein
MSRVAPLAGEFAVGRGAARIAGRALGGDVSEQAVLYSATGFFEAGAAAFRSQQGDGFTLRREQDGNGTHLTVSALAGGRPGRVLASEHVDDGEALVVRVPFEGRPRLLVLTAALVPAAEADARQAAAQRELRASAAGRPQPLRPPFEVEVLDR